MAQRLLAASLDSGAPADPEVVSAIVLTHETAVMADANVKFARLLEQAW